MTLNLVGLFQVLPYMGFNVYLPTIIGDIVGLNSGSGQKVLPK